MPAKSQHQEKDNNRSVKISYSGHWEPYKFV